tara:strand:- start:13221 stop:13712 length:492 start_codon:yes stop_codon:yes gene_type:complete
MIKKTTLERRKERYLFVVLFIILIFLSNLGTPGIEESNMMPNYFIALIISCILNKNSFLNLYKLLIIGLIVDLFVGQLLGQYGLIFINIYLAYFICHKILIIKAAIQLLALNIFLTVYSFLILWATSLSYGLVIPFNLLLIQFILTIIASLIFTVLMKRFTKN